MSGCGRTTELVELLTTGGAPDPDLRTHLDGCTACRRAADRAATFDLALRVAARSLAQEATLGFAGEPVATASAVWASGAGIDARAFDRLERRTVPWRRVTTLLGGVAACVAIAVAGLLLVPRVPGPAASPTLRAAAGVLEQLAAEGYGCARAVLTGPAAGSGPGWSCQRDVPGMGGVSIAVQTSLDGRLSSIIAHLPGSQTPENRALVQGELRGLVATPFGDASVGASLRPWVDAFFTPAHDPGDTTTRLGGLVLRIGVVEGRDYELDIYPFGPG